MDFSTAHEHLKTLKGYYLPPFCFEVFLTGGSSFYIQTTLSWGEDADQYAVLRIWDLRLLNAEDLQDLKRKMNETFDRADYANVSQIHPNLDVANLHVPKSHILYCVEWHDRNLPVPVGDRRKQIGFLLD